MKNIELTSEEKEELEKRGFLVIHDTDYKNTLLYVYYIAIYCILLLQLLVIGYIGTSFILYILSSNSIVESITFKYFLVPIFTIFFIAPISNSIYGYIRSGKSFLNNSGNIIQSGVVQRKWVSQFLLIERAVTEYIDLNLKMEASIMLFFIPLLISIYQTKIIISGLIYFSIFLLFLFILKTIYQYFNPLYAFGNIGEKIQKFTPEIESQSRIIQSEFEKDQNFSVLHSGFEKLSTTFSRIVELVLKLERVEKKANKGNLFDSEKYISSLRTDIITPLVELKKFLESQREELVKSQKELMKVMVGESSELSGNRELASRRGEEILNELDGNIGKLDIMITKLA